MKICSYTPILILANRIWPFYLHPCWPLFTDSLLSGKITRLFETALVLCMPASLKSSLGRPDLIELRMRLSVVPVNMSALAHLEK